jgi:hypothetical protein
MPSHRWLVACEGDVAAVLMGDANVITSVRARGCFVVVAVVVLRCAGRGEVVATVGAQVFGWRGGGRGRRPSSGRTTRRWRTSRTSCWPSTRLSFSRRVPTHLIDYCTPQRTSRWPPCNIRSPFTRCTRCPSPSLPSFLHTRTTQCIDYFCVYTAVNFRVSTVLSLPRCVQPSWPPPPPFDFCCLQGTGRASS